MKKIFFEIVISLYVITYSQHALCRTYTGASEYKMIDDESRSNLKPRNITGKPLSSEPFSLPTEAPKQNKTQNKSYQYKSSKQQK